MEEDKMADEMFEVACGSLNAMQMIKEKGFKALNPNTMRFQVVDKKCKYEIAQDGILAILKSGKNLIKIAEEKGLIC